MSETFLTEKETHLEIAFSDIESIDQAMAKLQQLREDLQKIRTQLSDRNRQTKMNWDNDAYRDWRHKAVHARNVKVLQISRLQNWIQSQKASRAAIALGTANPIALLGCLVEILENVAFDNKIQLSSSALDILSLSQKVVNENPVGTTT